MRASFSSRSGSGDSFQVLVRWKVILSSARIWRSRSRDLDLLALLGRQVLRQFADAPAGEGLPEAARALVAVVTISWRSSSLSGGDGHPPTQGPGHAYPCR